ncbi:hypothetical protein RB653_007650 [Dictyostelium firmibasis]|uniref:EGF-like domain-containing protein n=1 Tax=Dictyostelium firmibasis TaxID=79012 RepID=A0AAN7TUX7_9MYCE
MKLLLLLLIFIYHQNIINGDNSCEPEILTISEINPYNADSPIEITGTFCTKDIANISFYIGGNSQLLCENININDSYESLTCSLSNSLDPSTIPPINFNQFYNVSIEFNETVNLNTTTINYPYYLYVNSSCPSGCTNHGICDIGNTCRCDNKYASFNCAYKVKNESLLPLPTGTSFNQFKFITTNDIFNIKISHVLAIPSSPSTPSSFRQAVVDNQYITGESSTTTGLSFITLNQNYWLNSLYYNVDYFDRSSMKSTFGFRNYHGSYMPQSSTSSLITISPTINLYYLGDIYNYSSNVCFEMIFELTNLKNNMDSINWEISDSGNSILFNDKKSQSLLLFSLADIYSFNGIVEPNHSFLKLLKVGGSDVDGEVNSEDLINYSKDSMYLSITIKESLITEPTIGTYTIKLMINAYDTPGFVLQGWEIALIVFASVALFSFMVFIIVLIVRARVAKKRTKQLLRLEILDINTPTEENSTLLNTNTSQKISSNNINETTPLL